MLRTTHLHSDWEFVQTNLDGKLVGTLTAGWMPAQVPGHVHLDLMAAGVIADPFERMNELGCQWVDKEDWSYRTIFEWSPAEGLPNRVLRFEGLDTVCTVRLNGEVIAENDNMFVPLEINVTSALKEGTNELRVDFQSAIRVGEARRAEYFAQEGMADPIERFDERAFVRKAQYMYGWDWGPRLVSCGIWRPVTLIEFASRILDVHVTQRHHENGSVTVSLASEIEGEGTIGYEVYGPGETSIATLEGDGEFTIESPELWDPEDAPFLSQYEIVASLFPTTGDAAIEIDAVVQNFGICHVRLLREPDEFGESFEFEVNGRKIWARGANWIPDHSFPSYVSRERYREQLERAKDMGFNMLRVWGGGLYETDEFYELCDELGILVWQDFPFACSYYPDDEAWQRVIADEAYVNIKRIRNHPSLALWCGNNENLEMYANKWGNAAHHPSRYYGENHYDRVLPELVAKADPGRSYIATSPIGTPPAEKVTDEKRRGPNADGYGDQHNWDVWHGRGDWRFYTESKGRFSSEYGFASSCHTEVWEKTLDVTDWDPHSPVVQWHDKTTKGHDTFHGYVKLHYPEPITLEDWVYYSQLNQRDALRHGIEHYRRSVFCRGSLIWQLNDCWPVQSWAILDSDGNYKALGYELRRLYADSLVSIVRDESKVTVWAINDGVTHEAGTVVLRAVHLRTGEVLREFTAEAELEADSRRIVLEGTIDGLPLPDVLLTASWAGDETWQVAGEPKAARLSEAGTLTISTYVDGMLTIKTDTPLVDLFILDEGSVKNMVDNFVTVAEPGVFHMQVNKVPTEIEARSLAGFHRVIMTRSPL